MFESYLAVPFHFTIEFVGFMVTAGAALLIPTRPSLIPGRAVSRIVAALGFATLAAAQVAHGASFVPLDGDPDWALVRAAGLVLILLGLMGGGRSAPAAGAFVTADAPMLFAPAGAAALLAGWSLMVAAREGRATTRRLALAAFLIGVSEAVTAFVPDARFGQGVTEPLNYVSHGARLAGYVALVAWLWTGVRVSIRTRFVAAFTGLLMVVVLVLSGTLTGVLADNVQDEELVRLESQVTNQIQSVESDADQLLEQTEFVGGLAAVRSNERLLKRTIEEMIDNAVKFSPGGGAISVSARRVASNGSEGRGVVEIVVSDQGIGISSEDLPRIFSDFHQIDGSETRTYGGLGLGLAFVRRIVEAHSGTIEVTSEPEQGSTFTITLPELEEG